MMKVADYLSLGLACLAADLPETRVAGGDAVVYFRPGDPADLAARLESLLERPDLVEEMRTRARRRAPQLLWHWSAERLVASYDRLLASPRADVSRATVA